MQILITGHCGYIGRVATRQALQAGYDVVGLDAEYFGREAFTHPKLRQIHGDIRDVQADDLHGVDAIIHLAALSNDPMGALNPGLTEAINRDASLRLARLAKSVGVGRFVFASSCSIYGVDAADGGLLDETTSFQPISAYARSKVETEAGLGALADDQFSPVYMRNATAFGVGPSPRFDLVVNNLAGGAWCDGRIVVMSDGTPWRPLVHIEDIAHAALCAAVAPRQAVHNQAFNIGRADANYQVHAIAAQVAQAFPEASLSITGAAGPDPRSYRVSFAKALTELPGFVPRWTLEAGIAEVASFLRSGGLKGLRFDDPQFIRLKTLNAAMTKGDLDADLRWTRAPLAT